MKNVIALSGRTCNGKTRLAQNLRREFGFKIFDTSKFIRSAAKKRHRPVHRLALQKFGDMLDKETKHKWVFTAVLRRIAKLPDRSTIVIDNVRTAEQLRHLRRYPQWNFVHVHLYAPKAVLRARFSARLKERKEPEIAATYNQADLIKNERDIKSFRADADVRVFTNRSDAKDTFVRVSAYLRLFAPPDIRCVDVLVGGQYGSEGKGHVAAYLAKEYDVLVRVGGPNAGHTVSGPSGVFTYHQLPSGCQDTDAEVLLGPGATLYVPALLKEIHNCGLTPERLYIDPQAMIIEDGDRAEEAKIREGIASTASGSGFAAARRITQRLPGAVKLAKDIPELAPYVGSQEPFRGSTLYRLELAYRNARAVLLEGTQGSGLSIFHGHYPFVTSRDTNVAGCLAEAGISPSRVRRVMMVVRTTPIRVGNPSNGTSGPLKHETNFETVALEAQLSGLDVKKAEKTSTTNRDRRVGWFDWELFHRACALNAPTDIILTFADYLNRENQKARRFEQLQDDTIKFIEEIERVAQCPVSLINTRFPRTKAERLDLRSVIDRRKWWASPRNLSLSGEVGDDGAQQGATMRKAP